MAEYVPDKLYKYQPYSTRTLDNLQRRIIWFSHPSAFNDPFDVAVVPKLALPTGDEEWNALAQQSKALISQLGLMEPEEWERLYLSDGKPNVLYKGTQAESTKLTAGYMLAGYRHYGVACLSGVADDILMWAHYADGHRGLCLEFDTSLYPFTEATPVLYSGEIPSVKITDALLRDEFPKARLMTTKSKHWAYEHEWRVFSKIANAGIEYDAASLTGVYFGCAMPREHMEVIALLLRDSPTQLCEMVRSETEFEVVARLSPLWQPPE